MTDDEREDGRAVREEDRSALLTACGRLLGSVGIVILVVLLPATFLVVAANMGLVDAPGWSGGNTVVFGFFVVVVPAGLALAAVHFLLGGLVLARRFWPLVVTVLLLFSVVTLFPLGLRISWPFLGLTRLRELTPLTVAKHRESSEPTGLSGRHWRRLRCRCRRRPLIGAAITTSPATTRRASTSGQSLAVIQIGR
jgi:hypothetical protein